MKKVVLVMLVILMNVCFISCESNDEFEQEMDLIEVSTDNEEDILPPRDK